MTALLHALANLARLRWLGAAFCALAMLCISTHASALAGATAHARIDTNADNATTASAAEAAQTKDRVWGFDQNSPLHVWILRSASAETHRGISPTLRETASGPSYAAEGGAIAAEGGAIAAEGGAVAAEGQVLLSGGEETYQILDGVRRAKAAAELGQSAITAEVQVGGRTIATGDVSISSLLSPKTAIDVSTASGMQRWTSVFNGMMSGDTLPPIIIQPGATGTPIPLVGFTF